MLVNIGFKQIEVGFPSSSDTVALSVKSIFDITKYITIFDGKQPLFMPAAG